MFATGEREPGGHVKTLWIAHRVVLIDQALERLREAGYDAAGISPNHAPDPWASIQVASVDTLLARGYRPPAGLVIWDEAHHAAADTYQTVLGSYPTALHAGLTATPQRRDGRTLGDHYDAIVIVAQYSELLAAGHLVQCRVSRPDQYLGSDLAKHPLEAWRTLTPNALTFAFAPDVKRAHQYARDFLDAGISSAALDADTPDDERKRLLADFRAGHIRVLWNVYVLTEGVDVPAAQCCLLARGVSHAGPYLQIVGRVLRPAPGKDHAVLLDLSGASHLHGFPTQDREYALDGSPIRVVGEPLKNCPQCGATIPVMAPVCPQCGYVFEREARRAPRIWDLELKWAVDQAGGDPSAVSPEHKSREFQRLRSVAQSRRWGITWAIKEYKKLFGEPPQLGDVTDKEKMHQLQDWIAVARQRGFKPGFAKVRYKETFGTWPPRAWLETGEVWHG
jgi:superfamily II DNA or RNA helicase